MPARRPGSRNKGRQRQDRPGKHPVRRWILLALPLLAAGAVAVLMLLRRPVPPGTPAPPPAASSATSPPIASATFVGRQACAACHGNENEWWQGSHHDLAMQPADDETVLGDFENATLRYAGVTSTFFKREGKFMVRTDGPDGKLHDYTLAYTFGIDPLQQYLVEFPGGRLQALGIAWDTRPAAQGGQRWFHLHPGEKITSRDILHWTGPYQNWNFMCAECHSTNLEKNYRAESDSYETTWSEIDVSCEACHGPGSDHVAWAEGAARGEKGKQAEAEGLAVRLGDPDRVSWEMDSTTGIAKRSRPRQSHVEIEACARCHSLRSDITKTYVYGRPLLDTHRPVLLDPGVYHADGQIEGEVYEYGSFLQSRMYRAGVTCSDCHDPHSLRLKAPGDAVCARCHLPAKFDTAAHHFHQAGSPGASCIECHMPSRTYMVVDPRRDHSLRVPRPDLTVEIGTPNACGRCHRDRSPEWARAAAAVWWGDGRSTEAHYGEALNAGRTGAPGAGDALARLADDTTRPAIARATAVSLLQGYLGAATLPSLQRALADADPLVRAAAAQASGSLEPQARLQLALPSLADSVRGVRVAAARALASVSPQFMTSAQRARLEAGVEEYRESQLVNADRADMQNSLAALDIDLGRLDRAEAEYKTALRLDPRFPWTYLNLADLYRIQGRDAEGERLLRQGLEVAPDVAGLHHALGLLLLRAKRAPEALISLGRAVELDPGEPRFSYVYAVVLHAERQTARALEVLRKANARHPWDRDLLLALATISRDTGQREVALEYARKLAGLYPQDPEGQALLAELKGPAR